MSESAPGSFKNGSEEDRSPPVRPLEEAVLRRGLTLYLEDLQRAGVTHLLFPRIRTFPATAPASSEATDQTRPEIYQETPHTAAMSARKKSQEVEVPGPVPPLPSREPVGPAELSLVPEATLADAPIALPQGKNREEILAALAKQVAGCVRCPELVRNRTQTVFGVGNPHAELVFIGEAPGMDEDIQGFPFVGRAGQLLTAMITNGMGMRREDVYICNILRCRPPNNRTPTRDEAANCRPWLDATLAVIQPKYICCLGSVAAQNLLGTDTPIGRLRGKVWEYRGAKVVCTYHPAFLLRNPAMKRETWEDLKLLLQVMGRPIPTRGPAPK